MVRVYKQYNIFAFMYNRKDRFENNVFGRIKSYKYIIQFEKTQFKIKVDILICIALVLDTFYIKYCTKLENKIIFFSVK